MFHSVMANVYVFVFTSVPLLCFSLSDRCILAFFSSRFFSFIVTVTAVEGSVNSVSWPEDGEAQGWRLLSQTPHM